MATRTVEERQPIEQWFVYADDTYAQGSVHRGGCSGQSQPRKFGPYLSREEAFYALRESVCVEHVVPCQACS